MSRRGNAMLVSGSIYQACKLYEMFSETDLAGKCAIVTTYVLTHDGRFLVMGMGRPPRTAEPCQKALLEQVL